MLNYKEFGEGEPVVILHGLFGMLDNWQSFAKKLAADYRVIIVDQRDHGKSKHTNAFNYKLLAQDLHDFFDEHGIYGCSIIGHSMGGKTAMQFAVDFPDFVQRLIVVDIGPDAYPPGHHLIYEALHAVDINSVQSRKEVETVLAKYIEDSGVRLFLMKNLTRKKEGGYAWKMNLKILSEDYPNIIAGITRDELIETPTLFVGGSKSVYLSDAQLESISSTFMTYHVEFIEGAGHWVHAEKPLELLELVQEFLD